MEKSNSISNLDCLKHTVNSEQLKTEINCNKTSSGNLTHLIQAVVVLILAIAVTVQGFMIRDCKEQIAENKQTIQQIADYQLRMLNFVLEMR